MASRYSRWHIGVSLVPVIFGGLAIAVTPATAQAGAGDGSQAQAAPQDAGNDETDKTIIITGSRIVTGFDRPTPVTVLGAARLEERGSTNLGDALNELPTFRSTQTPASTGLSPAAGYIGGRILDLRGLGAVRTLTLIDGKRFVPSTTDATVDTNMIPSILLSRAEVVTGGASAVYGSDAVSGVVNLILDKKMNGIKTNAQVGFSQKGDNYTRQFGIAGGWQIGSNLHLVVGGEYERNGGVGLCQVRDWCVNGMTIWGRNPLAPGQVPTLPANNILPHMYTWSAPFNGVTTPPRSAYVGRDTPALRPIDGITFNPDGTPRHWQFGTLVNPYWQVGGENDGPGRNIYFDFPIVSPTKRAVAMGYLTWEATPKLTLELGVNYGHGEGWHNVVAYRNTALTIHADNPFLPRSSDPSLDIPTLLADGGLTSFTLGKGFDDIGPAPEHVTNDVVRIVTSAAYELGSDWKADIYYQYGHNKFHRDLTNGTITGNLLKALDAVTGPGGVPVCRVNADTDPSNDDPNCVPLDPFGYANGSTFQAAKAYITANGFQTNVTEEHVVAANVTGSVVQLPAGKLGVAVGAEFRSDAVNGDTDALSQANKFFNGGGALISGKIDVFEVYGETEVPILADTPGFKELGVNAAIRQTHYKRSSAFTPSSTVDATTWKVGAVWSPVDAIRFRVTRSRDIRAPNVAELFGPISHTTGILTDTGNGGLQVVAPITHGSYAGLVPEKADTWTVGVVLQPRDGFLGRFRASVDYYDINIKDEIGTLGQQNIVNLCAQQNDALACSLITRAPDKTILNILDTYQNVSQLINRGIDFQLSYRQPIGTQNTLSVNLMANNVRDLINGTTQQAGQTGLRAGTPPGMPDWTVDGTANLDIGKHFAFSTHVRWINKGFFFPSFQQPGDPGYDIASGTSVNTNTVPSRTYVDILGTVKAYAGDRTKISVYFGIDNLFDIDPPKFPGANLAGNNILFNPVGRMFKMGIRGSF